MTLKETIDQYTDRDGEVFIMLMPDYIEVNYDWSHASQVDYPPGKELWEVLNWAKVLGHRIN